jgi:hypothetical protein
VAGFDRLNPFEPHHTTALGARRVFQVIDSPFHRKIKARTDAQAQLSASDDDDHRSTASKMVETYRRMVSVRAKVFRYDMEG